MSFYIQHWNYPHLIYLLIPMMLGMILFVFHFTWKLFRAHNVHTTLVSKNAPKSLKPFIFRLIVGSLIAFSLSTAFLLILPITLPFVTFLLAFTVNIALAIGLQTYLYHQMKAMQLLPEKTHKNLQQAASPKLLSKYFTTPVILLFVFALIILAMMGPEGNERTTRLKRTPLKVTVLFDLSASMNANDVSPTRLNAAKNEAQALLKQSSGDDIGLIFFTDNAFIQAPQTPDTETLQTFIRLATPEDMQSQGTDIRKALELALTTFDTSDDIYFLDNHNQTRRVVLITDGETHSGDLNATLEKYLERKIQIDVIAVGTENGAQLFDKQNQPLRFEGKDVISKLQTQTLEHIAQTTSGVFTKYRIPEHAVQTLIANWDAVRINAQPAGFISSLYREQLYRIFLYPAYGFLILFFISPFINLILTKRRLKKSIQQRVSSQNTALPSQDEVQ